MLNFLLPFPYFFLALQLVARHDAAPNATASRPVPSVRSPSCPTPSAEDVEPTVRFTTRRKRSFCPFLYARRVVLWYGVCHPSVRPSICPFANSNADNSSFIVKRNFFILAWMDDIDV